MMKYIGKGAFLYGVPARDLTDEEAVKFGEKLLLDSGMYVRVGVKADAPQSKRLRSGKPVMESPDEAEG
jgi:hypothetical protein